ncbi:3'5'-cyclic nucleotide phosphodiesterase domain-containing protein [Phthorimaea operculella]|nr:3'5'-cyclic nucleotide phosphodiesterase domain-containing protein [Phthorimaea operculella]
MASASLKKHKRKTIQYSDPGRLLELVMSLYDENCSGLQVKINSYLAIECEAELVLQIVINVDRKEAFIEAIGHTELSRKNKIDVTDKLMEVMKGQVERSELFSTFADDFQNLVSSYLSKEPEKKQKKRIVLLPVLDKPFSVIVCVAVPQIQEETVGEIIYECFMFVWPTLKKSIQYEFECTLKQKCQDILKVAKKLFTQIASLETLLQIAMEQAKNLTKAEHCSVKLVDFDRMELVEAPIYGVGNQPAMRPPPGRDEDQVPDRRFPMNRGIVGEVIKTGKFINCRRPTENKFFRPEIDALPGIKCSQLLCFPIREQSGIIGVGQLINKIGEPYFDAMDEEMALAFSIYCGICIMHSVVYKKIQEAHIRNRLANELVMYHMKVTDQEVQKVLECNGFHHHPHAASLHFSPRAIPVREMPCYVYKMYSDLGFVNKFQLKAPKLARFILHVRKGYRDVPYHNFQHAFNVAQWAYAVMMNFKLMMYGYLTDLQGMMYLTAGLVHDLDHRGTTNSFQLQGQTTLAALYSSEGSVMERHHLAQAMCILNTEGCEILETLPRRDYDRAIMLLKDLLLASDLANYFKNKNEYMCISNDFNKNSNTHSAAFRNVLMNAADLGDQLKDWQSVKKTAAAVLTEFFKQGDVEKERGDLPAIIMDRDKCVIPELEIQFLTTTCIPLFTMLAKMLRHEKAQACTKILENHVERWEAAKPIFAEVPVTAGLSVLLSPELDNLIEINMKEKERLEQEAILEAARLKAEEEEKARIAAEEAAAKAAEEDDD